METSSHQNKTTELSSPNKQLSKPCFQQYFIKTFQNIVLKSALKSLKKLENMSSLKEDLYTKNSKKQFNRIRKILNNCKINQSTKIKLNKEKHDLQKQINKR